MDQLTPRDRCMQLLRRDLSGSLWLHRWAIVYAAEQLDLGKLNELLEAVQEQRGQLSDGGLLLADLTIERFG